MLHIQPPDLYVVVVELTWKQKQPLSNNQSDRPRGWARTVSPELEGTAFLQHRLLENHVTEGLQGEPIVLTKAIR